MNIIPFSPRGDKPKPTCQGHIFVDNPKGGEYLAEVLDYGEYAVVRMFSRAPLKRYVVDTPEEGMRLAFRLGGYPDVGVVKDPKSSGYLVAGYAPR